MKKYLILSMLFFLISVIFCSSVSSKDNLYLLGKYIVIDPGDTDLKKGQLLSEEEYKEALEHYAGSAFTADQAVQIVARGGKIMMVGTHSKPVPINFLKINREVTIQTSFRYCNNFPQTIEAIASGKFNVKDMVTHIYDYKDVQQAFTDAIDPEKKLDMVKGVVKVAQ